MCGGAGRYRTLGSPVSSLAPLARTAEARVSTSTSSNQCRAAGTPFEGANAPASDGLCRPRPRREQQPAAHCLIPLRRFSQKKRPYYQKVFSPRAGLGQAQQARRNLARGRDGRSAREARTKAPRPRSVPPRGGPEKRKPGSNSSAGERIGDIRCAELPARFASWIVQRAAGETFCARCRPVRTRAALLAPPVGGPPFRMPFAVCATRRVSARLF